MNNDLLKNIVATNHKKSDDEIQKFDEVDEIECEDKIPAKKIKKINSNNNMSVIDILNKADEENKFVTKTSIIAHVPIYISDWITESARRSGKSKSGYLNLILEEFYKAANNK